MKKSSKNSKKKTTPAKNTKPVKNVNPAQKRQGDLINKNTAKVTAPAELPEPARKSSGGLRDASEADADTVEVVRGEFLSDTFKAKITIAFTTATFNTACVNLFPDCQHVLVYLEECSHRLIVEPTSVHHHFGWKFANLKNGRNAPRQCTARQFCPLLFELMKWDPNAKYRILAIYQDFGNRRFLIFNLDDCLEVFSETVELEDGKKKRNTTIYMPEEWKGRFGLTKTELAKKMRLDFSTTVVTIDSKTGKVGEKKIGDIEPMPPTEEELILRAYGGKRTRKEEEAKENE